MCVVLMTCFACIRNPCPAGVLSSRSVRYIIIDYHATDVSAPLLHAAIIWRLDAWLFSFSYREFLCKERTTNDHCPLPSLIIIYIQGQDI